MSDARLAPGAVVDRWRVTAALGEGASGVVLAAVDAEGREVALKVLRRAVSDDPVALARFQRETRALEGLRHPCVVEALATGRLDDGRPYLVMPRLRGATLRELLTRHGRLSPDEAWRVARDVALGLEAAHAVGVVHRDVKPDNVFVTDAGARLLDFGVARAVEAPDAARLTATGAPLGTPAYMAPEQWWGAPAAPAMDQYALGVTLFESLTGALPFEADRFAALVQAHLHAPPPTLASRGVACGPEAEALVARLLDKRPEHRFATMRALVDAGDEAFRHAPASSPPAPAPSPAPTASLRAAALTAAALAAVWAAGYAGPARHDPRQWFVLGGFAQYLTVGLFALGLAALPRARPLAAFALVAAPALSGTFASSTGWGAILTHLPRVPELERFAVFSAGSYEANTCRFVGFALAATLGLGLAARAPAASLARPTTLSRALGVRRAEAALAAAALVATAAMAAALGAPSGVLVATAGAALMALSAARPPADTDEAARDEFDRALAGALTFALAVAAAVTRVDAREAVLWSSDATRAARVDEIVATARERAVTLATLGAATAVMAAVEALRVSRLVRHGLRVRPSGRSLALLAVLALGLASDLALRARFVSRRDALRRDFAAQFALFARLAPPVTDRASPRPRALPTALQVSRDAVAVDARGVARVEALASPEGFALVVGALSRALAERALDGRDGATPLALTLDADVPGPVAARALSAARRSGVTRADVLLTRGAPPRIPAAAPPEAAAVLPSDFVAVPVTLADEGLDVASHARWSAVARSLARADAPVSLRAR